MAEIPHAVLSEQFGAYMEGRRLHSAVFMTFQFEPAFFELQVLPVFLDVPLSHAEAIRLIQLEDALRGLPGEVAVYYDANGLLAGDGSAKLDIRRIPVRHRTGVFHPKNVFLLLEDEEPDENGYRARALLVACLSANLTQHGWWENVECCHIEEIPEGAATRLRDDLLEFLGRVRRQAGLSGSQAALGEIIKFLRSAESRRNRSTDGMLHTHFHAGVEALPDFLDRVAGDYLRGAYLEVISPFFDDAPSSEPLETLLERFQPRETRVFLPRAGDGQALCRADLYDAIRNLPGVSWGNLPQDILRRSRIEQVANRTVHAKVYRFFTQNPKREICFVGSANLTRAAHLAGGNVETGFLVDRIPARRPEFWLESDMRRPGQFMPRESDDTAATARGSRLGVRYHWDRAIAEACWDDSAPPGALRLEMRGINIGTLEALAPRAWAPLPAEMAARLADLLRETSIVFVHGEASEALPLLVQEEGMSHKPSLLFHLTAADILQYWSLLSPEQRAAFLEQRAPELALSGLGADLVARVRLTVNNDTLFDRFAGIFHAFGCLERAVHDALKAKHEKEADYRLFGRKYDSLGSLLDRVQSEAGPWDDVDRYVIVMCARQLARELERAQPNYWSKRPKDVRALEDRFKSLAGIRQRLVEQQGEEFNAFLEWFDRWFIQRAEPLAGAAS